MTKAAIIRLVLAWLHLLALGIGLGGVWGRARALRDSLREPADARAIKRALTADVWWGIAAVVWIVTGVWRLLAGTEKTPSYYLANHAFYAKMGMLIGIITLEVWPMMTLMRWRSRKMDPDARDVGRIEVISYVECALVIAMVFAAISTARGLGMRGGAPVAARSDSVTDSLTALGDSTEAERSDSVTATAPASPRAAAGEVVTPLAPGVALDVLAGELTMPLPGIDPMKLHSSFNDLRAGVRRHEALDIMAPRRTPVVSAASGRVLKLFTSKDGGLMVYAADSAEQFILMYAHLDSYAPGMRDGLPLARGQLIGYVGSTGNASPNAPHLHFAIAESPGVPQWWKGMPVDPLPLLQRAASRRP